MLDKLLTDKRKLLFYMSLCITIGGWIFTLPDWSSAIKTGAIGGLLILLGNNVFANMIKNVGLLGTAVTNESEKENHETSSCDNHPSNPVS
jgi:hypothetical protein